MSSTALYQYDQDMTECNMSNGGYIPSARLFVVTWVRGGAILASYLKSEFWSGITYNAFDYYILSPSAA